MEVYTLFRFFESAPLFAALYLLLATGGGWLMMRAAKVGLSETIRRLTQQGGNPGGLLIFGKMWAMGALLFFPGYITDFLALLLLAAPGRVFGDKNKKRITEIQGREDAD